MGNFSQDTIKRKSRPSAGADLLNLGSASNMLLDSNGIAQTLAGDLRMSQARSIPSATMRSNHGPSGPITKPSTAESDSILINFAEIRQFTERVRNVIYFSSIPYSNDLLTNTKESQRTQAQIKKMHEEWQMRKRIRHYISQTLATNARSDDEQQGRRAQTMDLATTTSSDQNLDQVDGNQRRGQQAGGRSATLRQQDGRLNITYDERTLYRRSLEIEPELNPRPQVGGGGSSQSRHMVTQQQLQQQEELLKERKQQQQQQQQQQQSSQLLSSSSSTPSLQPHIPLPVMMMNLQPAPHSAVLPSVANSSPTLSMSSSLSSCSSFNHHNHLQHHHQHLLPNYHASRGSAALTSSLGKFGTESTESLRKLKALSESVDNTWRSTCNSNNNNNTHATNGLGRISATGMGGGGGGASGGSNGGGAGGGGNGEKSIGAGLLPKNLVPSRIFPSKSGR